MKKLLIPLICIALASCHEGLKERTAREAHDFTRKNCPQRLANGLTCDSLVFSEADSTLHYYYTIEGEGDDSGVMEKSATQMREALLASFRNDVKQRTFKEASFSYGVTIHSKKQPGTKLYEVRFTKKDYQ